MTDEATIAVPDRRDDQDVVDWVKHTVGQALFEDHRRRSPLCLSSTTEFVKIPIDTGEEARIGTIQRH